MDALVGNPIKAFMYQDHQAHIATHQAFMQDPQDYGKLLGKILLANQITAALQCPHSRAHGLHVPPPDRREDRRTATGTWTRSYQKS